MRPRSEEPRAMGRAEAAEQDSSRESRKMAPWGEGPAAKQVYFLDVDGGRRKPTPASCPHINTHTKIKMSLGL